MSKRRKLESHRKQLLEIRNIMNSMKNLAYLETRKLSKRVINQNSAVQTIKKAALDILQFYPELRTQQAGYKRLILLIGSERGFCGDYNESLLEYVDSNQQAISEIILVGDKLSQRLEHDERVIARLSGASSVDETGGVLNRIVGILAERGGFGEDRMFTVVYHDPDNKRITSRTLLPFFYDLTNEAVSYATVPDINLQPSVLLNEIAEHYLLAQMRSVFYAAMMAENLMRIDHMENALRRLDEKTAGLDHQYHVLRQEEIIEEIEVILLNAKLAHRQQKRKREIRRAMSGLDDGAGA